jgi:hypothetical protein
MAAINLFLAPSASVGARCSLQHYANGSNKETLANQIIRLSSRRQSGKSTLQQPIQFRRIDKSHLARSTRSTNISSCLVIDSAHSICNSLASASERENPLVKTGVFCTQDVRLCSNENVNTSRSPIFLALKTGIALKCLCLGIKGF